MMSLIRPSAVNYLLSFSRGLLYEFAMVYTQNGFRYMYDICSPGFLRVLVLDLKDDFWMLVLWEGFRVVLHSFCPSLWFCPMGFT